MSTGGSGSSGVTVVPSSFEFMGANIKDSNQPKLWDMLDNASSFVLKSSDGPIVAVNIRDKVLLRNYQQVSGDHIFYSFDKSVAQGLVEHLPNLLIQSSDLEKIKQMCGTESCTNFLEKQLAGLYFVRYLLPTGPNNSVKIDHDYLNRETVEFTLHFGSQTSWLELPAEMVKAIDPSLIK